MLTRSDFSWLVHQTRIQDLLTFKAAGASINRDLNKQKDLKNPDILDRLIKRHDLLEIGSNYPPEIFNPFDWPAEAFYDKISEKQLAMMEEKKKAKEEAMYVKRRNDSYFRRKTGQKRVAGSKWDQSSPEDNKRQRT